MSVNASKQQKDCNTNDWNNDDDDSWDDWGDAEENTDSIETPSTNSSIDKEPVQEHLDLQNTHKEKRINNPDLERVQSKSVVKTTTSGWSGLFGGVVTSVLNTASEGLGNITSTVTHSLDKVIGVPDPEEMARINVAKKAQPEQIHTETHNESSSFGLSLVSGVTTLGSKVLNSGLDTLEGIGKKTMDILQENDPLLKTKIKKLTIESEKPNLTELLKQAKLENESLEQSLKQLTLERNKAQLRFEVLFENKCGLVYMEALEILSKEAQLKLDAIKDSVSGKALEDLLEIVQEIKELLEMEDLETDVSTDDYNSEELQQKLSEAILDAELKINFDDITSQWSTCLKWLNSDETRHDIDAYTMFSKGLNTLSEACALEIQKFHKIAELLLVKDHHSTANEVDAILQLTKLFINHLQVMSNRFANMITVAVEAQKQEDDEAQTFVSTLFSEMLLARQYIEKAFHLFPPILQIGAV